MVSSANQFCIEVERFVPQPNPTLSSRAASEDAEGSGCIAIGHHRGTGGSHLIARHLGVAVSRSGLGYGSADRLTTVTYIYIAHDHLMADVSAVTVQSLHLSRENYTWAAPYGLHGWNLLSSFCGGGAAPHISGELA